MGCSSHSTHEHEHSAHEMRRPIVHEGGPLLSMTEKAVEKVKSFAQANKDATGKQLRICVQGGGCSGFQYGFNFDDQHHDDQVIETGGIKVVLDPVSLPYLQGATVDWVEDLRGSGFVVQNPNASGSCGCGSSFSV